MAETSTKLGRVSLVPRGAYDASAVYDRLDIVEYEGSGYLALADVITGVTPENGPLFMLLAARGGKGDPGEAGVKGDPGKKGDTGAGIQSVERTAGDGAPGTADTYTITLTNGNTSAFTVYNGADGTSFTVLGRYDTLDALKEARPAGGEGEAWAVGSAEDNEIYLWDAGAEEWRSVGSLQGPAGADGKSAYQQAVDGGYTGTEEAFNQLLASGPWLPLKGGQLGGELSMGFFGLRDADSVSFRNGLVLMDGTIFEAAEEEEEVWAEAYPDSAEGEAATDDSSSSSMETEETTEDGEAAASGPDAEEEAPPEDVEPDYSACLKLAHGPEGDVLARLKVADPEETDDAATRGYVDALRTYVDGLVGEIGRMLDTINGEAA